MVSPLTPYRNERDNLGGGSEVAAPIFLLQSGFLTSQGVPDCRAGAVQHVACPPIHFPDGRAGAGASNPPAGPCNLITRFDGWQVIVPLMFISLEEPHD